MPLSPARLLRLRKIAFYPRRYFAWRVEREGTLIALLVDPAWNEMFWDSYRVVPVADDPQVRAEVQTEAFWRCVGELTYREQESGWVHPATFPGGTFERDKHGRLRITMRSLMFSRPKATLCERWIVRRWRARRKLRKNGQSRVE